MLKKLFKKWSKKEQITILNKNIETLKAVINDLEKELYKEKEKNIENQNNMVLILENSIEARRKITDLENNIEFLVNNLSKKKRELICPPQQN